MAAHHLFLNLTTRSRPVLSHRPIRCTPRRSCGRGWSPRRCPPVPSWPPAPTAPGPFAAGFLHLQRENALQVIVRSHSSHIRKQSHLFVGVGGTLQEWDSPGCSWENEKWQVRLCHAWKAIPDSGCHHQKGSVSGGHLVWRGAGVGTWSGDIK